MDTPAYIKNPIIPVDDVKVHILLMMSISKLQESIEGGPIAVDHESGNLLPSQETVAYIQNAVQRFRMWLDYLTVSPSPEEEPIPPLDVLMIWHAYMLSPSVYYQDSGVEFPVLKTLGGMPWNKIAACIEDDATFFISAAGQIQEWEKITSVPFNRKIVDHNYYLEVSNLTSFSIDLVAAVLRQSQSLMNMLTEIKWHSGHALDEWINNAIIRYPQFMRLSEQECIPPVDVDIIWHTHQLAGPKYWDETLFFFGVHIDHSDDITPQAARAGRELMGSLAHMLPPNDFNEPPTASFNGGTGVCNTHPGGCLRPPVPPRPEPGPPPSPRPPLPPPPGEARHFD